MRTLPPLKAVSHALRSVITYRMAGLRIGAYWIAILFALDAVELLFFGPGAGGSEGGQARVFRLLSVITGFFAFSSIAVNWHRFILRDEAPTAASSLRLDAPVLRYIGNSFLAILAGFLPFAVIAAAVAFLPRMAVILLLPASVLAGTLIMMLSLKLPAVALDLRNFTFGDALKSAESNFWQVAMVFLLNALVILAPVFALASLLDRLRQASPIVAAATGLVLSVPLNLFLTLVSVSVLTSLYGFFVEKRDF